MKQFQRIHGHGGRKQGTVIDGFLNLLFRWRGSIFKLMWPDLLIFLLAFYSCTAIYRFLLNPHQQRIFEQIASYCEKYGNLIPVSFVLGFYVSLVVSRWWAQYKAIPFIDTMALWVNSVLPGNEESDRLYRRTIMRYMVLAITQCFSLISPTVKKRFPAYEHYIAAGLLTADEKAILEDITTSVHRNYQMHWIPCIWAANLIMAAREENKIKNDTFVRAMLDEINKTKDRCNLLLNFDRICVPIVYTQVVTLAVYSYFLSCVMGRQWLYPQAAEKLRHSRGEYGVDDLDLIVPVFTILQFFFYMGWLKVAETLANPFGEDDNDFELQWLVDRSLMVSYLIVDEIHKDTPNLVKDIHWSAIVPLGLPHTKASKQSPTIPPPSSTTNLIVDPLESQPDIYLNTPFVSDNHFLGTDGGHKARVGVLRDLRRRFLANPPGKLKSSVFAWMRFRRKKAGSVDSSGSESKLNVVDRNGSFGAVGEYETGWKQGDTVVNLVSNRLPSDCHSKEDLLGSGNMDTLKI